MADETTPTPDDQQPPAAEQQPGVEEPAAEQQPGVQPPATEQQPGVQPPATEEQPGVQPPEAEEHAHEQQEGVVEETTPASEAGTPPAEVVAEHDERVAAEAAADEDEEYEEEPKPREKPAIPGADLEVDIVLEGEDRRERSQYDEDYVEDEEPVATAEEADQLHDQPIAAVEIDLTAEARYRATGKRKTSVARVILRPGTGQYTINGRPLEEFFPRPTLQRNIRQPLEAVGYADRMDVVARMHGGGVYAQAGALRHGISRALLEADPNLRTELKRRGFLTRDARVKERKKAGLKKARKRPQFSKR
jgi:small subunit ribosomal protein S9